MRIEIDDQMIDAAKRSHERREPIGYSCALARGLCDASGEPLGRWLVGVLDACLVGDSGIVAQFTLPEGVRMWRGHHDRWLMGERERPLPFAFDLPVEAALERAKESQ